MAVHGTGAVVRGGAVAVAVAAAVAIALAVSGCVDAEPTGEPISAPGVEAEVDLVSPGASGAGPIPTFEWAPVDGTATYRLVVVNGDGAAIWAWEGPATSVVLGGVPDREEGDGGPILMPGSTWSVVALDPDGHVVAVSSLRPVSP